MNTFFLLSKLFIYTSIVAIIIYFNSILVTFYSIIHTKEKIKKYLLVARLQLEKYIILFELPKDFLIPQSDQKLKTN